MLRWAAVALRRSAACRRNTVAAASTAANAAAGVAPPTKEIDRTLYHTGDFTGDFELLDYLQVYTEVISRDEEALLVRELNPGLRQKQYQGGHWDRAISGYRETERVNWTPASKAVLDRMYELLPRDGRQWLPLHVLDLHSKGIIFPHVDSPKFSGDVVAGLSLYSDALCTFDLHHDEDGDGDGDGSEEVHTGSDRRDRRPGSAAPPRNPSRVQLYLPRRSFYVTSGPIRCTYAHGIRDPHGHPQFFQGTEVPRKRRISVLFRDALPPDA